MAPEGSILNEKLLFNLRDLIAHLVCERVMLLHILTQAVSHGFSTQCHSTRRSAEAPTTALPLAVLSRVEGLVSRINSLGNQIGVKLREWL